MNKLSRWFSKPLLARGLYIAIILASILLFRPREKPLSPGGAMASPPPLNSLQSLQYDRSLGMFGQSDHVGMGYPFSAEALRQPVPGPEAAAGQQQAGETEAKILSATREVVHHEASVQDANAAIAAHESGALWVAYTSFRKRNEDIYIRSRSAEGTWQPETRLSTHSGADFNPAVQIDAGGRVWVVWSRQESASRWPLVARYFAGGKWSEEQELAPGRQYLAVLKRNRKTGDLWLAWENWNSGTSLIRTRRWDGRSWSEPHSLPIEGVPQQRPALASGFDGSQWLAYDVVQGRKYDVRLAKWDNNGWAVQPLPPEIEGHRRSPAMDVDRGGRVWLLPETLVVEPIQVRRSFFGQDVPFNLRPPSRAALVWTGTAWKALPPGPAMSAKAAALHIDRTGSVWIISRTVGAGSGDFISVGQRYRGSDWYTGPLNQGSWTAGRVEDRQFVVGENGINSTKERIGLAETGKGLTLAWHQTHRKFTMDPAFSFTDGPVDTIVHHLPVEPLDYQAAGLIDFDPRYHGTESPEVAGLPKEAENASDVSRTIGGRNMQVYYGDLHHHTEYSRDPGVMNDDVENNYRYVRDIRRLDFLGLADHTEHLNEHDWYRTRRAASFFNIEGVFSTFVAFEWTSEFNRGGNYQEGHHNVVHRTDGPEVRYYSASLSESNTPMRLIELLEGDIGRARQKNVATDSFLFPHDPSRSVQPITWSWYNPRIRLLELVQSRGAHEILGGPQKPPLRNDIQQLVGKSAQDGLKRGFRWGFIGNGDHFGRPVAAVFSPSRSREAIFDSLNSKQSFATTGTRMVVSFSVDGHFMGTEWKGKQTEHNLDIYARGTRGITLVEVWKNGRMLYRWSPASSVYEDGGFHPESEFRMQYKDLSASYFRENWWYLRVMQEDGEIAWSSPVWFVFEDLKPEVIADAGQRQPIYVLPQFPVPIPILMRNQKADRVSGTLALHNVPDGWRLEPEGAIEFVLPPESWKTLVWYVKAPAETVKELKMVPIELEVAYQGGGGERIPLVVLQSPKLLNTRGQLDELSDALHLQRDINILNGWLKTMALKWGL